MTRPLFLSLLLGVFVCHALASMKPDKVVGTFGNAELEFQSPGVLATDGENLFVADRGNSRVQKIKWNGEYIGEMDAANPDASAIGGIAVDVAGTIYVSGRAGEEILQFARDLHLLRAHQAAGGMLAYEPSGNLFVLNADEVLLWGFSLSTFQLQEIDMPPLVASERPFGMCVHKGSLWILTEQSLIQCDLFGTPQWQIALPQCIRTGSVFGSQGQRLFVVLDRELVEVTDKAMTTHGGLSDKVTVGGAVAIGEHFWVSDKQGHRLLRYKLPGQ